MSHVPAEDLEHILTHVSPLWDELRGARLFITGGTGFFGKWLLESFVWANTQRQFDARAVVLTRDPAAFRRQMPHLADCVALEWHTGDVRSFALPEGRFSHIIHAATPSSSTLNQDEPETMLDTIIQGTRRMLELARRSEGAKFLLTSSGAVYGRQPPQLTHVGEEYAGAPDPLDTRSAYGEGKRVAEQLCAIYHQRFGVAAKIARCFAFVGPHLPLTAHFAIGNFLRDGLAGGPIQVGGDGTPYRSFQYAADLMIWLWTILLRAQPCRPYNVGSEESLSIADLARKVADSFHTEVRIARAATPGQPPQRYVPSTQRACRELDLRCRIPFEEALDRTVRWLAR